MWLWCLGRRTDPVAARVQLGSSIQEGIIESQETEDVVEIRQEVEGQHLPSRTTLSTWPVLWFCYDIQLCPSLQQTQQYVSRYTSPWGQVEAINDIHRFPLVAKNPALQTLQTAGIQLQSICHINFYLKTFVGQIGTAHPQWWALQWVSFFWHSLLVSYMYVKDIAAKQRCFPTHVFWRVLELAVEFANIWNCHKLSWFSNPFPSYWCQFSPTADRRILAACGNHRQSTPPLALLSFTVSLNNAFHRHPGPVMAWSNVDGSPPTRSFFFSSFGASNNSFNCCLQDMFWRSSSSSA